ncbi:MAG TPA: hypothetical protein VMT52_12555 [Planctomycetota bacterium]|nr:hypothetical protein [Planctomycetota bacterium]
MKVTRLIQTAPNQSAARRASRRPALTAILLCPVIFLGGLLGGLFDLRVGPRLLAQMAEASHARLTPSVRLGDEIISIASGTVAIPIYVKNEQGTDGLFVTIDYDELFLGYAWYRNASPDWRAEGVTPYGTSRITIVLKRTARTRPSDSQADGPEVLALHAVFFLKEGDELKDRALGGNGTLGPFMASVPFHLGGSRDGYSTETYFFTQTGGQGTYSPVKTKATPGSALIYYRSGVEAGSGGVTRRGQEFTLPLFLTYIEGAEKTFSIGIDYDELFLGCLGVRGVSPPAELEWQDAPGGGRVTFKVSLENNKPVPFCRLHVADISFWYNGERFGADHMLIEPELVIEVLLPEGAAAAEPAPDGGGRADGAGASTPGAEPGVVEILPAYFVRGNVDSSYHRSGAHSASGDTRDVHLILKAIFLGGDTLPCEDAADLDDDGTVELSDAILLLNFLVRGGAPPASPFPASGIDETPDLLGCEVPLPYFEPRESK